MTNFLFIILSILLLIIFVFHLKNKERRKKISPRFPYCNVFYKTEDSIGWHLATLNGAKDEVETKCKEYAWYQYKIYDGYTYYHLIQDNLHRYPSPYDVALTTDWIYWEELDKWFINTDEIIPYPTNNCELSNNIEFSCSYTDEEDDEEYAMDLNNPEDFCEDEEIFSTASVKVKSQFQTENCIIEMKPYMYKELEKFYNNLRNNGFAVLHIDEWGFHKFLVWVKDDKIRFIIQLYEDRNDEFAKKYPNKYVPIVFDTIVNKDIFWERFEAFYTELIETSKEVKNNIELVVKGKKLY